MNEYVFSADVVRVILVAGVIISIVFYERVQLTTGGSIVPAYLALGLIAPVAVITTVGVGFVTYLIVHRGITRRRILYGRRLFEIEVLIGLVLIGLIFLTRAVLSEISPETLMVSTIGFLVPGIIAHDMGRQGPWKTVFAVAATTAIVALFMAVYVAILKVAGAPVVPEPSIAPFIGFDRRLLLVAVVVSVLMGMLLFERLGIRSGGFISAAYLAFLLPRWGDLLFIIGVAFVTWLVVARGLMPRLLLFGRRKLSTMILFGALIGWTAELVIQWWTDELYQPGRGLAVMMLMVPALIANDTQRQGWERTFWGVGLATLGVYGVVNLVAVVLLGTGLMPPNIIGDE